MWLAVCVALVVAAVVAWLAKRAAAHTRQGPPEPPAKPKPAAGSAPKKAKKQKQKQKQGKGFECELRTLRAGREPLTALAVARSEPLVAVASMDRSVRVWAVFGGACLAKYGAGVLSG